MWSVCSVELSRNNLNRLDKVAERFSRFSFRATSRVDFNVYQRSLSETIEIAAAFWANSFALPVRVVEKIEHICDELERIANESELFEKYRPLQPVLMPRPGAVARITEIVTPDSSLQPALTSAPQNASMGVDAVDNPVPDGPGSQLRFYWKGNYISFASAILRYRLCAALWDTSKNASFAERGETAVLETVYGEKPSTGAEKRLKNLVRQVNTKFEEKEWSLRVKHAGGKLWLEAS